MRVLETLFCGEKNASILPSINIVCDLIDMILCRYTEQMLAI